MTTEALIHYYPRAYHMAEVNTWDSIRRHGLLSTTALLDLFEIAGQERQRIESERRPECVTITHPVHGTAVIRDQKPMSESALKKCLRGATPQQWYELLNRRTFFWLSRDRLNRLLNARAYRDRPHCILTVDTARLLAKCADNVTLSPINTGSTIMKPQLRNPGTFSLIGDYPFDDWLKQRGAKDAVVELAVDYAVYHISEVILAVEHQQGDRIIERIWTNGH